MLGAAGTCATPFGEVANDVTGNGSMVLSALGSLVSGFGRAASARRRGGSSLRARVPSASVLHAQFTERCRSLGVREPLVTLRARERQQLLLGLDHGLAPRRRRSLRGG